MEEARRVPKTFRHHQPRWLQTAKTCARKGAKSVLPKNAVRVLAEFLVTFAKAKTIHRTHVT